MKGEERRGKERKGEERRGKERKGEERRGEKKRREETIWPGYRQDRLGQFQPEFSPRSGIAL